MPLQGSMRVMVYSPSLSSLYARFSCEPQELRKQVSLSVWLSQAARQGLAVLMPMVQVVLK